MLNLIGFVIFSANSHTYTGLKIAKRVDVENLNRTYLIHTAQFRDTKSFKF